MPPTVEIEAVSIVKPLKVLALICGLLGMILIIIGTASNDWLYNTSMEPDERFGLFEKCSSNCTGHDEAWHHACAGLSVVSLVFIVVASLLTGVALVKADSDVKTRLYKAAIVFFIIAAVLILIALIVYPAMFHSEVKGYNGFRWEFGWAYGMSWGGFVFTVGAAILLIYDRNKEEVYYREKTTYYYDNDGRRM